MNEFSNNVTARAVRMLALCVVLACGAGTVVAAPQRSVEIDRDRAVTEYTKGIFLLESGSPEEALPHLEAAWEHSGQDEPIGEKLADTYFRLGNLGSCERVLERLLSKNKTNRPALFLKAKILYVKGERVDALQYLRTLKATGEKKFETERMLAKVLFELGRDEEALEAYKRAIDLDPYYPFLHYTYGLLLRKFQRSGEAEEAMRDALRLEPRFADAAMELAGLLIEDERLPEAEEVLETLLDQEIDAPEAVIMTANLYFDQGKLDEAIRLLEGEAQRSNLTREGRLLLGRVYYEAKDYEEAFTVFGSLFDEDTRTAEMARVLGEISLKAGRQERALKYYREAIELGPQDYRNYMALFFATSSRFSGDDSPIISLSAEEIVVLLQGAAKVVDPDDFEAIYLLGVSYQSMEAYAQAREYLARALELRPDDERALLNLGAVLERLQLYAEAERHVMALHERKPEDATICNFYGYLLALMGKDLDKAEALVQTALKHEPNNGYYTDSLGWVYYRRGDYARAIIELEKASSLVGDDPVILEHLGDAYRSLKRYREALAAYEKSLDLQGENSEVLGKINSARERLGN
ncbi:MAG: tetratricopeptide repeat protein [Candidatus Krumholzibacteriia bacterium]